MGRWRARVDSGSTIFDVADRSMSICDTNALRRATLSYRLSFVPNVNQVIESLSLQARARLRWGGYVPGESATEELRAAGLIRHAPEHVYRCGPDVMVQTPDGADVSSELRRRHPPLTE